MSTKEKNRLPLIKKISLALLFLILGLMATVYELGLNELVSIKQNKPESNILNFYLNDLNTHIFNENGQLTKKINAVYASQLVGSHQIDLSQPRLEISLDVAPWIAIANAGSTSEDLKEIALNGSVKLTRQDGVIEVTTESLVFDSAHELAYTKDKVLILAKGSETTAKGVLIDLNKEIIQLKKNVKTHYVPNQKRPDSSHSNNNRS